MAFLLGASFILFLFGPLAVVSWLVLRYPHLALLCITGSFFYLLSTFLPSFFIDLFEEDSRLVFLFPVLLLASLSTEFLRFIITKFYHDAEDAIILRSRPKISRSPFSDFTSAIAVGLGFSWLYTLIMQSGTISAAFEENVFSDFFPDTCPELSIYLISGIISLCFQLLHVSFSLKMFNAFRQDKMNTTDTKKYLLIENIGFHYAACLATVVNGSSFDAVSGCAIGLPLLVLVTSINIFSCVKTITSDKYEIK